MTAYGYIRQSKRADLDVALSYDSQLAAIHRLAEHDGTDPERVTILADMGRSGGRGKERLRAGYQELAGAIESRSVDVIYALSMSRVARSTVELQDFYGRCAAAGVRVVYEKEAINFATASGKMHAQVLAAFYEFERDLAVERARDNVSIRRSRGDRMGRVPYGEQEGHDPEAVIQAYRDAKGSLDGTARLLNQRNVPTWTGERVVEGKTVKVEWTGSAVRNVVVRLVPGILPNRAKRGVKPTSPFVFYQLLRCPCGRVMTASRDGRGNREPIYRCHAAGTMADHPRPYRIRESQVMPWIMAEAARFRIPADAVELVAANEVERANLEDQRRMVGDALVVRAYTPAQAAAKVADIEAALAKLDEATRVEGIPQAIDWTWPTATINNVLRAMWRHVELGPDLLPVRAEWLTPEWRS